MSLKQSGLSCSYCQWFIWRLAKASRLLRGLWKRQNLWICCFLDVMPGTTVVSSWPEMVKWRGERAGVLGDVVGSLNQLALRLLCLWTYRLENRFLCWFRHLSQGAVSRCRLQTDITRWLSGGYKVLTLQIPTQLMNPSLSLTGHKWTHTMHPHQTLPDSELHVDPLEGLQHHVSELGNLLPSLLLPLPHSLSWWLPGSTNPFPLERM